MILILDLSYKTHSLSRNEFVGPITRIVDHAGRRWKEVHFSEIERGDLEGSTGIILCGTALKDNLFATRTQEFAWLQDISVPLLGICAGMQVLCLAFGGFIRPGYEIGMTQVRVSLPDSLLPESPSFQAYELHSFACDPPEGWVVTAVSDSCVQTVHHPDRPLYGVMFHPEVRNDDLLIRFLSLCRE